MNEAQGGLKMKLIGLESLLSVAKDVTLANGAKHRCIDATEVYELPTIDIVPCKDCIWSKTEKAFNNVPTSDTVRWCDLITRYVDDDWHCADGEQKGGGGK